MLKEDLRRANVTSSVEWAIAHKRYFLWVANAAVSLSSSRKAWVADETATRCGDCWGKGCGGGAISRSHEPAFCNAGATLPSSASLLKLSGASIFGVAPLAFLPVPSVELERQITSSHCRAALHAIARCLFRIRVSALEASGGEGGIRTLGRALWPYDGLARCGRLSPAIPDCIGYSLFVAETGRLAVTSHPRPYRAIATRSGNFR